MNSKLYLYLLYILLMFSAAVLIPTSNYVDGSGPQSNESSLNPEFPQGFERFPESDPSPPPTGLMQDLNFSELSEFDLNQLEESTSSSSSSSLMNDVNGTYINPDIGFQVDLPKDWNGKEIKFLINSVFAAPEQINLEDGGFKEPGSFMTILGINEGTFNMLADIDQLSGIGRGGGGGGGIGEVGAERSSQGSDPLDIATAYGDGLSCKEETSSSFVTINGINAEQRSQECTGVGDGVTNPKTKSYAFATQNNSLIVLGFFSNSTTSYNENLPLFEESVKTIKISKPTDIAASEVYKKYKELELEKSNQTSS
jgi:hypothetical protein